MTYGWYDTLIVDGHHAVVTIQAEFELGTRIHELLMFWQDAANEAARVLTDG